MVNCWSKIEFMKNSETHSSIVDGKSGCQINDDTIKLVIWFDNESGHAYRIIDLITNFHIHYDELDQVQT